MKYMRINIIGNGKFGTALAWLANYNGNEVKVFARTPKGKEHAITEIGAHPADIFIFAIAFKALESVFPTLDLNLTPESILVNVAKGIHEEKLLTASDFFAEYFPGQPYVSLSGPNFSQEIMQEKFTTTVLAATEKSWSQTVGKALRNDWFRPKSHRDVRGIELCGALKNVMAIASGMYGAIDPNWNPRAAFFTESLREMQNFISVLGGQADTTLTNAGVGDLILTANSDRSRNFRFGTLLGQGKDHQTALTEIGSTVEGINATKSAYLLAQSKQINAPIIESVYQVLYQEKPVTQAWVDLLKRLPADN